MLDKIADVIYKMADTEESGNIVRPSLNRVYNALVALSENESGGSSGGAGSKPDWNQTNAEASDYIKNKPKHLNYIINTVLSDGGYICDKTYSQIYQAYIDGYTIYGFIQESENGPIIRGEIYAYFNSNTNKYNVIFINTYEEIKLVGANGGASNYPKLIQSL